jgi:hypothetical protein
MLSVVWMQREHLGKTKPIQMDEVSLQLIASSLRWLVFSQTEATDASEVSAILRGREVFDWAQQIIQHQKDLSTKAPDLFLTEEAQVSLLHLILALLAGRSDASSQKHANSSQSTATASSSSSKRKVPDDKAAAHAETGWQRWGSLKTTLQRG